MSTASITITLRPNLPDTTIKCSFFPERRHSPIRSFAGWRYRLNDASFMPTVGFREVFCWLHIEYNTLESNYRRATFYSVFGSSALEFIVFYNTICEMLVLALTLTTLLAWEACELQQRVLVRCPDIWSPLCWFSTISVFEIFSPFIWCFFV